MVLINGGEFSNDLNGESGVNNELIFNASPQLTNLNISLSGKYLYESGNLLHSFTETETGTITTTGGRMYKFFQIIPSLSGYNYITGNHLFSFLPSSDYEVFDSVNLIFYSKIAGNNYLNFSGSGPSNEFLTGITVNFAGYRDL